MTSVQSHENGRESKMLPPSEKSHVWLGAHKIAFSVEETARALSVGRTKLYELVKTGEIRATKLGRRTLFLVRDIDAFLDRLRQEGGAR